MDAQHKNPYSHLLTELTIGGKNYRYFDLLKLKDSATLAEQVQASIEAGDAVMYRMYQKVKNDGGHIAEQIGRSSGAQTSAKDLTWSYANLLSAMQFR